MSFNLNSLWLDWRAKVPDGTPNPDNAYHLVLLKELCFKQGIDKDIIDNVILVLEKEGDDDKYTSVGHGYYKLNKDIGPDGKGKDGTPTFEKDDNDKYGINDSTRKKRGSIADIKKLSTCINYIEHDVEYIHHLPCKVDPNDFLISL